MKSHLLTSDVEKAVGSAASFIRRALEEHAYGVRDAGASEESLSAPGSPEENAELVKQVAAMFGASLTGICVPERRWFTPPEAIEEMGFTEANIRAVVIAIAMDADAFEHAPCEAIRRATTVGYMEMSLVAGAVAEFVRELGHRAVAQGNAAALSAGMAEKAGLGQIGWNCMLVTREFGPCVRLCKVFTDMPLAVDAPQELGVRERCADCNRCIDACPVSAIKEVEEPKTVCEGVVVDRYWRVDREACRSYWNEIGGNCGICIAECPYTPGAEATLRNARIAVIPV